MACWLLKSCTFWDKHFVANDKVPVNIVHDFYRNPSTEHEHIPWLLLLPSEDSQLIEAFLFSSIARKQRSSEIFGYLGSRVHKKNSQILNQNDSSKITPLFQRTFFFLKSLEDLLMKLLPPLMHPPPSSQWLHFQPGHSSNFLLGVSPVTQ